MRDRSTSLKLLANVLRPAARSAGLGRVTWHQFRHIHSSLLNDLRTINCNATSLILDERAFKGALASV